MRLSHFLYAIFFNFFLRFFPPMLLIFFTLEAAVWQCFSTEKHCHITLEAAVWQCFSTEKHCHITLTLSTRKAGLHLACHCHNDVHYVYMWATIHII
jgi:hypothetical protein